MYPTQSLAVVKIQMGKTEHFFGRGAFPASQNCLGQNVWVEKYPPPFPLYPLRTHARIRVLPTTPRVERYWIPELLATRLTNQPSRAGIKSKATANLLTVNFNRRFQRMELILGVHEFYGRQVGIVRVVPGGAGYEVCLGGLETVRVEEARDSRRGHAPPVVGGGIVQPSEHGYLSVACVARMG